MNEKRKQYERYLAVLDQREAHAREAAAALVDQLAHRQEPPSHHRMGQKESHHCRVHHSHHPPPLPLPPPLALLRAAVHAAGPIQSECVRLAPHVSKALTIGNVYRKV